MYEKIVCPDTVGWVVRLSNKSQSQDIVKGDLAFLKDVKEIQVAYVYENITVGKDGKEATYIKREKAGSTTEQSTTSLNLMRLSSNIPKEQSAKMLRLNI